MHIMINGVVFENWLIGCVKTDPSLIQHFIDKIDERLMIKACEHNPFCIKFIKDPSFELMAVCLKYQPTIITSIPNNEIKKKRREELEIIALNHYWNYHFYYGFLLSYFNPHSKWFYKEVNKLKLKHGSMNEISLNKY